MALRHDTHRKYPQMRAESQLMFVDVKHRDGDGARPTCKCLG